MQTIQLIIFIFVGVVIVGILFKILKRSKKVDYLQGLNPIPKLQKKTNKINEDEMTFLDRLENEFRKGAEKGKVRVTNSTF